MPQHKKFITALRDSSYYQYLFLDCKPVLIALTGSRVSGYYDELSDYDIEILVSEPPRFAAEDRCLTYQGHKVHWYYHMWNLSELNSNGLEEPVSFFQALIFWKKIEKSDIIYIDNQWKWLYKWRIEHKNVLAQIGSYALYDATETYIQQVIDTHCAATYYAKTLSQILYSYMNLTCTSLDTEYFLRIKRICETPVSQTDLEQCVQLFQDYQRWIQTHPFDYHAAQNALLQELSQHDH